ncbi:MAG: peroxiredoxin [Gammaproteobacteria bacterium]|nr:peroxiredoxin [Gammaproteobacteria bacterium]
MFYPDTRVVKALILCLGILFSASGNATPKVGEAAPDFKLQDQNSKWHSLKDYRGKWVVLYFYPKDDTPGCTTEACNFRDDIFKFRKMGVTILGVSLDDVESHKEFAEKYHLPFPLLADIKRETAEEYDVLISVGPLKYAHRETFIVNPEGVIAKHYSKVKPEEHSAEVLADLKELQGTDQPG